MSVALNLLTAYVQQNSIPFMTKGLMKSRTVQLVDVLTGCKNTSANFSIESSTLVLQNLNNGIVPSGTTTLTPITVSIDRLGVRESLNQDALEAYFESQMFKAGQRRDDASLGRFAAMYVAEKIEKLGNEIDKVLWRGDTVSGTGNLKQSNGFLRVLRTKSASTVNITATAITEANAIITCSAYYDKLADDAKSRPDITMFCGLDELALINAKLSSNNYAVNNHEDPNIVSLNYRLRPMRIEGVAGLNGTGRKIVGPKSFLKIATDLASDMPAIDGGSGMSLWFSRDDEAHYWQQRWAQGVTVAIPEFFVNDMN